MNLFQLLIYIRFTDLFRDVYKSDGPDLRPQIVEVNGKFYEEKFQKELTRIIFLC